MTDLVSILMPVYNAASTLEAAVSCVRAQTYPHWELILVNDGSTDQSAALCDALAGEDARIRVFHQENQGAGPARNRALAQASGDYVVTLDADDTFEPDMLEQAVTVIEREGVHTAVWGLTEDYFKADGTPGQQRQVALPAAVWRTEEEVHRGLLRLEEHTLFGYCCNKLYHRKVLVENGIVMPNEPLYEDFLFNAAYAPHISSLAVLPTAPVHYKKRGRGLTARFVPGYFPLSQRRVQTMWDLCREWGIADEARPVLGGLYVRYILSALQRNCDRRAGMTHATRREFLQRVYNDPLFTEIVPYAVPTGRGAAEMCRLLQQRRVGLCLAAGRVIYWVKTRLPGVFSRVSKGEGA